MAPISLKSNIASLSGQRQLSKTSNLLGDVYKRLSSGQRINRAVDDAAGLAIASSLEADSRLYTQAIRNINDAVSALTIADAAYSELAGITGRIIELAEQSANGVYSTQQRLTLDTEAQSLAAEYKRIVQTTSFNGTNLLDGSSTSIDVQVGVTKDASSRVAAEFGEAATTKAGDGTFGNETAVSSAAHNTVGDMNGDGNLDLIAVQNSPRGLYVNLGNGDGTFGAPISTTPADKPIGVQVADVNQDGSLDAIAVSASIGAVQVFLGDGDGTFQAPTDYSLIGGANQNKGGDMLSVADFNGDGWVDVAAISEGGGHFIEVFLNNGNGTFGAATQYSVNADTFAITTGDMNNDGNLDFVLGTQGATRKISVMLGNGNGSFQAPIHHNFGANGTHKALADFNEDGNLDVVSVDQSGDAVTVVFGDGAGNLSGPLSIGVDTSPAMVRTADLNGDDNQDIVVGSSIILGNGDGSFQSSYLYRPNQASAEKGLTLADLNNDGVLDIFVSRNTSDAAVLLGNTRNIPGLSPFSLQTASEARSALDSMKGVLDKLAQARGTLGASESRLQTAARNDIAQKEGSEAARAQIMDADVAETSALATRTSLLQQVSSAILAQANQQPQLALQLLG